MELDRDVHRDAASAFGPASATAGALLPFEGRSSLIQPGGPPAGAVEARTDGWAAPELPVLVRGEARILPLGWLGDLDSAERGVTAEEIAAFASQVQDAGMHWAGPWRVLSLAEERADSIGSYIAALRDAGATDVDCWTLSDAMGLALVRAGAEDEGTRSLALHIVPAGWVSEPRAGKPVRGIDVGWSWADVIALRAAD
ncbi:hypothetical protein [Microbacterium sp.]|uniref:hypothetical protein n=1 Tax=Microbacterium sp. TaxID=51671 RepID=UPI003F727C09